MLFRRNIRPSCSYCRYGAKLGYGEVACPKRGIMAPEGRCNLFRYEPTKREPEYAQETKVTEVSEEELAL